MTESSADVVIVGDCIVSCLRTSSRRPGLTSISACARLWRWPSPRGHASRARRLRARPLRRRSPSAQLALLWRPAIRLGAGTAHQYRAFTVAQAVGLAERLDGLFVVDDCEGASPVGPPQAAFETPGVEHTGEGVPDVRERIGFAGQRAGTADLITAFRR